MTTHPPQKGRNKMTTELCLCGEPAALGRDLCDRCHPAGTCAWLCGGPVMPGSNYCEDCAAHMAAEQARDEASERRQQVKAENARRLAELPPCDCQNPTLDGCAVYATHWAAMPKSRAKILYRELSARCVRHRQREAEHQARQEEQDRKRRAETEERRREHLARQAEVTVALTPSPLLTSLREVVLAARDDRCPKWQFKLAPDLVVQIQPRPAERRDRFALFEVVAIEGEGTTLDHFSSRRARAGLTYLEFAIVREPGGGWRTEPRAYARGAGAVMARLIDLLPKLETIRAEQMFTAGCLICGKALTDPASMARFIGPECAGTSSLDAGLFAPAAAAA